MRGGSLFQLLINGLLYNHVNHIFLICSVCVEPNVLPFPQYEVVPRVTEGYAKNLKPVCQVYRMSSFHGVKMDPEEL